MIPFVENLLGVYPAAAWFLLVFSFVVLTFSADKFVEGAVGVARMLRIPRLMVGLVLVSLATTAPELSVSLISALRGKPEMALGNAMGSIVCDDGLAIGLAGVLSGATIVLDPRTLRTSGGFLLLVVALFSFFVLFDSSLGRIEGATLLALFAGYLIFLYRQHRQGHFREAFEMEEAERSGIALAGKGRIAACFVFGLAGIILGGDLVVESAAVIAKSLGLSDALIAMTVVALGTSIPEVATCIAAARKGEGALAVGNILGADIMNICWVAGASALANPLVLGPRDIRFMLPAMVAIVLVMLFLLRWGNSLNRRKGAILLALYALYLALSFTMN